MSEMKNLDDTKETVDLTGDVDFNILIERNAAQKFETAEFKIRGTALKEFQMLAKMKGPIHDSQPNISEKESLAQHFCEAISLYVRLSLMDHETQESIRKQIVEEAEDAEQELFGKASEEYAAEIRRGISFG